MKKKKSRLELLEEENQRLKRELQQATCNHSWHMTDHFPMANYDVKLFKCWYCGMVREESERMD